MASATAQATREGARFTVLTVIESIASEAIEVGASTPVVAPLCTALLRAKDVVDAANQNKEDLEALHARCERITVQVIDKAEASKTSKIDVYPLQKCVVELKMVAEGYRRQRKATRMALFRKNGGDIQRLRTRIDATVRDMGLERVVDIGEKVAQILVRPPTLEFAHMPINPSCNFPGLCREKMCSEGQVVQHHTTGASVTHALIPPRPHPTLHRLVYSRDTS